MDTTELSYMAFDMAKTHGDEWHSALVAGKGGSYHALISARTGEEVIRAADDSHKSSWLCDYLEAISPKNILALLATLEAKDKRLAELEARKPEPKFRVVGVMSEAAFHRLERSESRFIALWPRPEIDLPRKRPDDGVIVYAKVEGE